jgi:hypothetical protein
MQPTEDPMSSLVFMSTQLKACYRQIQFVQRFDEIQYWTTLACTLSTNETNPWNWHQASNQKTYWTCRITDGINCLIVGHVSHVDSIYLHVKHRQAGYIRLNLVSLTSTYNSVLKTQHISWTGLYAVAVCVFECITFMPPTDDRMHR